MSSPPASVLPQAPILYAGELVGAEPERAELRCVGPQAKWNTPHLVRSSWRVFELLTSEHAVGIDGRDKARTAELKC